MLLLRALFWCGIIVFSLAFTKAYAISYIVPEKHYINIPNHIHRTKILGKDERKPISRTYFEIASGIGILFQSGSKKSWGCTAFCVAPDIIATNAHCLVPNPNAGKYLDLSKVIFHLPGIREVQSALNVENLGKGAIAEDNTVGRNFIITTPGLARPKLSERKQGQGMRPQFKFLYYPKISNLRIIDPKMPSLSFFSGKFSEYYTRQSLKAQSQDWAFAKLTHQACWKRVLQFAEKSIVELKKAAQQKRVFMIGFHGDKIKKGRLLSPNCEVRSYDNRKYFQSSHRHFLKRSQVLLPHTCDAFKGASGSPIVLSTKKGPRVVAINLGHISLARYQVRRNLRTGEIVGRRKFQYRRDTNMAVMPNAFLDGLVRFERESILRNLNEFIEVQNLLKEIGFYKGRVDGVLGRGTRAAIEAYERKNKLVQLGLPTQELLSRLRKDIESRTVKQP